MEYLSLMCLLFTLTVVGSQNKTDIRHDEDVSAGDDLPLGNLLPSHDEMPSILTRRILRGHLVGDTRPYMVYLRPTSDIKNRVLFESHWTCGGVIIHERYILTSAACIEDVGNFYVISGTHHFVPPHATNECIINGAKKAVWKCIPKSYFFDGDAFDNIRWMVGDIAIVKVEDNFNFERRIKGCDFVPKMIAFNNRSRGLERSGTIASLAGWGTSERFIDLAAGTRRNHSEPAKNSPELLEADVIVISKKGCKKHWDERYHFIIQDEMICSKDSTDYEPVAAECQEHGIDCKEVGHSDEDYYVENENRRRVPDRQNLIVHTAAHRSPTRRSRLASGGFCENDHGGPLIVGQGKSSVVIGIMSACLTRNISHKCYGPFLFTSVFKYRGLVSCAIDKSLQEECRILLKSSNTQLKKEVFDWRGRYTIQRESDETKTQYWQVQRKNNQESRNDTRRQSLDNNDTKYSMGRLEPKKHQMQKQQYLRAHNDSTIDPYVGIKNVIMRRFYN